MKLHNTMPEGAVVVSGTSVSKSFGLADNAKLYAILSNNLYQDKIGSVVREYSCNALDSHIEAGYPDRPITVHLPDQFEPWFSVTDTGVGLSPERIADVFMIYGESTKEQCNDKVGAFGIGGKVGLAYCGAFSVTSVYDGVMYAYSMFIGENGIPQMATMMETVTDSPNGVEIKVPVEPADFFRFRDAVRVQLHHFPVKPIIVNDDNFKWDMKAGILFQSKNIILYDQVGYSGNNKFTLVQGPVGYAVDRNHIAKYIDSAELQFITTLWNAGGMDFLFDIGDISVVASRESVEFTHHTIASIKAKVAVIRDELVAWASNAMDTLPTVYEKAQLLNSTAVYSSIMKASSYDLSPFILHGGYYKIMMDKLQSIREEYKCDDDSVMKTRKWGMVREYGIRGRSQSFGLISDHYSSVALTPFTGRQCVVVLRDSNKAPIARMRKHFSDNNISSMLVIEGEFDKFTDDFITKLEVELGGFANIIRTSDMADPPRAASARSSGYKLPTAYLYDPRYSTAFDKVNDWTRVYDKLNSGELVDRNGDSFEVAAYVTVSRQAINDNIYWDTNKKIRQLINLGKFDNVPIYGIREGDVDKLDKDITWIPLLEYVKEMEESITTDPKIVRAMDAFKVQRVIDNNVPEVFRKYIDVVDSNTTLAKLNRIRDVAEKVMEKYNWKESYYYFFDDQSVVEVKASAAVTELVEKVQADLPFLAHASAYSVSNVPCQHMIDYINHFSRA